MGTEAAKLRGPKDGGRSSMVELQIVILVVAGSSPVGHPIFGVVRFFELHQSRTFRMMG